MRKKQAEWLEFRAGRRGGVLQQALKGLLVLVAEDVLLVAEDIAATLSSCGCDIVGPVSRLEPGLRAALREPLDGALLDITLDGELSYPIAEALHARGVPYIFLTGYSDPPAMPPRLREAPILRKPVEAATLVEAVAGLFQQAATASVRS